MRPRARGRGLRRAEAGPARAVRGPGVPRLRRVAEVQGRG
nr:MAG TPA: hypothetical protein [Caudoviricetes sp.]